ncbi:MAG: type II toxin-antitoxin system death-on-curing family toxin [Ignavibacteriaceae bacterium]|nr:type II toxin-antitoxin system death-on-curing family toxin [Ignavibacteriaceae bacterium]HRN26653.1 type II toxin-antitoxin system death-on-curing family toxin [Ignavibacteriaceae bacterium]HRP94312.1 type II toxin-antitoxin system death-on-curing family toxin [Ignavibacteriaceae bacterium]HRQ54355.1 type II toxin-antitoxin system death-on-curing family toxin [Ignavibacteriaceae bacterium]
MIYPSIDQVVETHKLTVKVSGGGSDGILDIGKLESVLHHIQNDDYYPSFEEKLNHLVFSANKFHCFEDGNKRISIALGALFLTLNGYVFVSKKFIQEMENISYHLAAGVIDKDFLLEIITSILNEIDYTEELKLKIANAISTELPFFE